MMIIADSGSTKTDWCSVDSEGEDVRWKTLGLNPYFHSEASVDKVLSTEMSQDIDPLMVEEVHFYGAGCSNPEKNKVIEAPLQRTFPNAKVVVDHDMLGAARALFMDGPGIACILGTGSNSCVYDGKTITQEQLALGYLLGDWASGAQMGKEFTTALLQNELPEELGKAFFDQYELTPEQIIHNVYKEPYPNRFLASFAPFLSDHLDNPVIENIVVRSFDRFVDASLQCYINVDGYEVRAIGSVALHFESYFKKACENNGFNYGGAIASPMHGLVDYHKR